MSLRWQPFSPRGMPGTTTKINRKKRETRICFLLSRYKVQWSAKFSDTGYKKKSKTSRQEKMVWCVPSKRKSRRAVCDSAEQFQPPPFLILILNSKLNKLSLVAKHSELTRPSLRSPSHERKMKDFKFRAVQICPRNGNTGNQTQNWASAIILVRQQLDGGGHGIVASHFAACTSLRMQRHHPMGRKWIAANTVKINGAACSFLLAHSPKMDVGRKQEGNKKKHIQQQQQQQQQRQAFSKAPRGSHNLPRFHPTPLK